MQQDNGSKHTFKLCSNYLHRKEESGELKMMVWPPQTPDLNLIELLWDELNRVWRVCSTSQEHLWETLEKEWNEILNSVLENS